MLLLVIIIAAMYVNVLVTLITLPEVCKVQTTTNFAL